MNGFEALALIAFTLVICLIIWAVYDRRLTHQEKIAELNAQQQKLVLVNDLAGKGYAQVPVLSMHRVESSDDGHEGKSIDNHTWQLAWVPKESVMAVMSGSTSDLEDVMQAALVPTQDQE